MPIENNLPQIFDTATQTEDGLMSYQDKIKLDGMTESLNSKIGKDEKIKSTQLDTSSDSAKIQPDNLSDAVKKMMTGKTAIDASVPNNGVTTEKIAQNAVTVDKIDKRLLLGNIVSPRPLNFAFDTKKVSITVPQGSLLLLDGTTSRILVTGSDIKDMTVNLNYPTEYTGLNYIVSATNGTLSMINYRKVANVTNTNTVIALVNITSTFAASVVMNGNYTINGLAQGIGTESAALLGIGKIVFDALTGIIDFSEAEELYLVIGGMYNRTLQSQASIRLANYSGDSIYSLYWDNATSSLKTSLSTVSNVDTDINKIAMIKDGRIIPFVDTGIFYSKPSTDSPYYTETFDFINNISLISKIPMNINTKTCRLVFTGDNYVCLNENNLLVKNTGAQYTDREGLFFILFDLDSQNISCRHYKEDKQTDKKNILIGTMWIKNKEFPEVTGNFQYTVDGKNAYQDDLSAAENSISELQDKISSDLTKNPILVGPELYTVNGEDLPIYGSSMMYKTTEGITQAIQYKKEDNQYAIRNKFFDQGIYLDPIELGTNAKLLAASKYDKNETSSASVKINRVASNVKAGQTIKILCLGDDLINDKVAYYVKNKLTSLKATPKMLGTMVNSQVYGEGRKGWFYSTFVGASGRGQQEGKITPQTSKGSSSVLLNPFVRVANADDKANKPNDCYRASGAYIEKNYYNDTDKTGAFYIFDFAKYLEVQGIETPDVVVIAIKPELSQVFTDDVVSTNMQYLKQMVAGIRAALPDAYIALIPQYAISTKYSDTWELTSTMVTNTVDYVSKLKDTKVKVVSSWLHMCREFGTESSTDSLNTVLSDSAKLELANSITAFILNI